MRGFQMFDQPYRAVPEKHLSNEIRRRIQRSSISKKPFKTKCIQFAVFLIFLLWNPCPVISKSVTDQFGRTVEVPDHPYRIIALAPSITEILYKLEMENRLVGVTQFSNYPPPAKALPKVGSYIRLDVEKIASLEPDLCIAVKDGNPITAIRKLESIGIPVYAVDPRNLEAVMDTLVEIGQLLGVVDRAKSVKTAMNHRIQQIQNHLSAMNHRPGVFFQIGITPIVSVGTPTFIHELIKMAGGNNLAQGPTPYPRFSKEQVIGLWPDVMIITSMARATVFEQVKTQWEQWPDIPAVKNKRIHLVDSDIFDRASPRLVEGLETLARLIHPNCFQSGDGESIK
jgi:iron complex transport system substrate-binding protein